MTEEFNIISDKMAEAVENNGRIVFVSIFPNTSIIKALLKDVCYNMGVNEGYFFFMEDKFWGADLNIWGEDSGKLSIPFEMKNLNLTKNDIVIAITSGGHGIFATGVMEILKNTNIEIILITNSTDVNTLKNADHYISIPNEPLIYSMRSLEGTTKLKIIIDILLISFFEKAGITYKGLPVFYHPNGERNREHAVHIIEKLTGKSYEESEFLLMSADDNTAVALTMSILEMDKEDAKKMVQNSNGNFKKILESLN